jgi:hypothetical protein
MAGAVTSNAWVKLGAPSAPSRVGTSGELSATNNSADSTMSKRFYLATRKDRSTQAEAVVEALRAHGWERTFAWTGEEAAGPEGNADIALAELAGVREADVLIVLLPGGYGTHVEIGAALALGKSVILHAPNRETLETPYPCVFHYHPGVKLFVSELLDIDAIAAVMAELVKDSIK